MNQPNLQTLSVEELRQLRRRVTQELHKRGRKRKLERVPYRPGGRVRHWKLYVLYLSGGKYYVGITAQKVESRYRQHVDGTGAKWTKRYRPLGIMETYSIGKLCESDAVAVETAKTLEIMELHGSTNVRGGSLVQMHDARVEMAYQKLLRARAAAQASQNTSTRDGSNLATVPSRNV